ncbi:hypothetical protein C8R43DRAFT_1102707 [Mycena crocata]|nr:hypothetical protein C8R43DRAFT_1102707 [Mycena crocata]
MSTKPDKLVPRLSVDLEREIFELTARECTPAIPRLMLVARRVEVWVKPFLYRAFSVTGSTRTKFTSHGPARIPWGVLGQLILSGRADSFHGDVRHLHVVPGMPEEYMHLILDTFSGRQNFCCFGGIDMGPVLLPTLTTMAPQRLAVNPESLFGFNPVDFLHPVFARVTHLHLRGPLMKAWTPSASLSALPYLTHLAFQEFHTMTPWATETDANALFAHSLAQCAHLKVLVFLSGDWDGTGLDPQLVADFAHEARFVPMVVDDLWRDWEAGAVGGEDFWDRADAIVKARQSGKDRIEHQ